MQGCWAWGVAVNMLEQVPMGGPAAWPLSALPRVLQSVEPAPRLVPWGVHQQDRVSEAGDESQAGPGPQHVTQPVACSAPGPEDRVPGYARLVGELSLVVPTFRDPWETCMLS